MLVGADPLDRPHRPRPEASAGPVRHAEVHGHADQRHVEPGKAGGGRPGLERRADEGRRSRERPHPPVRAREDLLRDRGKKRVEDIAALCLGVPFAQRSELFLIHD